VVKIAITPGILYVRVLLPNNDDPLTAILRKGARRVLSTALEAEIEGYILHSMLNMKTAMAIKESSAMVIHLPEREIQTGIGQVAVKVPRVRDRQEDEKKGRIRFSSSIIPAYHRKAKSVEKLLPW